MREIGSIPDRTKSDRLFTWLGKIVKSSISQTLNYMSPDWITLVNWCTPPNRTSFSK